MGRALSVLFVVVLAAVLGLPWLGPLLGQADWGEAAPERGREVALASGAALNVFDLGSGRAIVLVHGLPGDAGHVAPLARALAARGFRAVYYDRVGYGHSSRRTPGVPHTIAANAAELIELLDALGLRETAALGFSYGGAVVQEAAILAPERLRPLVFVASVGPARRRPPPGFAQRVFGSAPVLRWAFSTRYTARRFATPVMQTLFLPDAAPPAVVDRMLAALALPGAVDTWLAEGRAADYAGLRPELVSAPALVVHGTGDRSVAFEVGRDLAERLPTAEFVAIDGGGHALPLARSEELAGPIAAFLQAH
jgi:non-heme chloroperoxidase